LWLLFIKADTTEMSHGGRRLAPVTPYHPALRRNAGCGNLPTSPNQIAGAAAKVAE
jgi:hypothetical protein